MINVISEVYPLAGLSRQGGREESKKSFKSTRFKESVLAMTIRETKSLYESSSVAVKVERTSSSSSPPCLN